MLEAKQKKTFLDEVDVLGWANQLADALTYLHSQNPPLVHRDVKPSNLKITPNGLLKLVDFGLVKALVPDEMTITVIQDAALPSTPLWSSMAETVCIPTSAVIFTPTAALSITC